MTVDLARRTLSGHRVVGLQQRVKLGGDNVALVDYSLTLLNHAHGSHGLLKHLVVKTLGGYSVTHDVGDKELRHGRQLYRTAVMLLVEYAVEPLVGHAGRHESVGGYVDRCIVMDETHLRQSPRLNLLIGFLIHDAAFKQCAQRVYQSVAFERAQAERLGVVDSRSVGGHCRLLDVLVTLIYGTERRVNAVAHVTRTYSVKVYWHVAWRSEQRIGPGLSHLVVVGVGVLAGKEPYDNHNGADE